MGLQLDDCSHCACVTLLVRFTKETAIAALERGEIGCDNCMEDEEDTTHHRCVALFDDDGNVL